MWTLGKKPFKRKLRNFGLGLAALICIPVLVNLTTGNMRQFESLGAFIHEIGYGFSLGAFFWLGNWSIGVTTGRKLDWNKNPRKANMISLLSFIGFGIIVSLAIPYTFHKYVWLTPPDRLLGAVVGNAFLCISVDTIIISIYYSSYIVHYWGQSIKREEELKRENLIARYEALKNQVNPHFLFNTLNTLTGVVEKHPGKATEFIRKLSDIYRYVLEQKDKELVSLGQEVKFVEDYIYLSKIRYGDGLQVENKLDMVSSMIAPLGLQMLIENAIKHNVISDDQPLTVTLDTGPGYLSIRNSLQRKSSVEGARGVGLENLIKRYEYLSDRKVEIIENKDVFEVRLPILQNPEL